MSDEDLLKEISLVVARENEHLSKIKASGNKSVISVNSVEKCDKQSSCQNNTDILKKSKEDLLFSEINKLTVKVNELSSVKEDIAGLRKQLAESNTSNPPHQRRRSKFVKCEGCERNNSFCRHCLCGSDQHKRSACPKNPKN